MTAGAFELAIPSYRRASVLPARTLAYLATTDIPASVVRIFVADKAEARDYRRELPRRAYNELVIAAPGVGPARNFIQDFYPQGSRVVSMDDDLRAVVALVDAKRTAPVRELVAEIDGAFELCAAYRCGLWGVYPTPNPYFMRRKVTTDLCYICGGTFGFVPPPRGELHVTLEDKEDFERSILWYRRDGRVVRLCHLALDTHGYAGAGGMQVTRTADRVQRSAEDLLRRFPDFCVPNRHKKGKWAEVVLKDLRQEASKRV